jgi:hypothetical protein
LFFFAGLPEQATFSGPWLSGDIQKFAYQHGHADKEHHGHDVLHRVTGEVALDQQRINTIGMHQRVEGQSRQKTPDNGPVQTGLGNRTIYLGIRHASIPLRRVIRFQLKPVLRL